MAWTAPMTATLNGTFTAAQWNTNVRDNLLETEAAKAASAGRYFIATGANAIAERRWSGTATSVSQTTTSTTYTNLSTTGPSVSLTTGTSALVFWSLLMGNQTAGAQAWASVAVSGASTVAAADTFAAMMDGTAASASPDNLTGMMMGHLFTGLTAGTNTFTVQYRVSAGTGEFSNRNIAVMAL